MLKTKGLIEEWIDEAVKEAEKKALGEGVTQGKQETLRTQILRVLRHRFDFNTAQFIQIEVRLSQITNLSQLEWLADEALTATTIDTFAAKMA